MSDLSFLPVSELRNGLDARKFSSVELTRSFLSRIQKHANLNCFIESDQDRALNEAKLADARLAKGERGPLLGIPIAIKDIILTKGVRTTCGSKILENFVAPYDATCFANLKSAGAILMGKTNMDEFAMGSSNENSPYGPVRNPWNIDFVPGGSSGGSAASVSARLSPVALGTDTGGSIRQPASLCSIVGMKPTYGRVSRYGVVAFASSLDQVGAFATNVRDLATTMKIISGHDPLDSTSSDRKVPNFESVLGSNISGLRIGIPKEYFIGGINPEVEKSVREAISQLAKLGATLKEISLPNTEAAVAVYYILAPAEASSNLARYDGIRYGYRAKTPKNLGDLYERTRSDGFGAEVKRRILIGTYVLSTGYYDAFYLRAQKVRTLIADDFRKAFSDQCDVIACPASPTTAFRIGEKTADPLAMYLNDVFTIPVNLAGLPGMTVPCGFDSKGLPIGLQLIGKPWDEETLFRTGHAYESSTEWHKKIPDLIKE